MKPTDLQSSAAERTAFMDVSAIKKAVEDARAKELPATTVFGDQRSIVARVLQTPQLAGTETVLENPLAILTKAIRSMETPYDKKLELIRSFDFTPYKDQLAQVFTATMAEPAANALRQAILDQTRTMTYPSIVILEILKNGANDRKIQQAVVEKMNGEETFNPDVQFEIIAALSSAKAIYTLINKLKRRISVSLPTNEGDLSPEDALKKVQGEKDVQKKSEYIAMINPSIGLDLKIFSECPEEETNEEKERLKREREKYISTFIQLLAATNNKADIAKLFVKYNITLEKAPQQ